MYGSYRIGTLAEKIVAVKISLDGTITPIVRRRDPNGRMVDVEGGIWRKSRHTGSIEFVARVRKGDSGVVALRPPIWFWFYSVAMIPLGKSGAFSDAELAPIGDASDDSTAADADFANAEEVWFRFADGKLTWKSENVSGEAIVNETYPELSVALRLPPGNQGELRFAAPLFMTGAGMPASVLAVA